MQFYYESCEVSPSPIPPSLPINNRAFLYGDHAYEVIRTYDHIPFAVEKHFERFLSSLHYLKYDVFPAIETFRQDLQKIIHYASDSLKIKDELYIRCLFGRGSDDHVGLNPDPGLKPLWFYICGPLSLYQSQSLVEKGLKLGISSLRRNDPHSFSPNVKTGNYGNNLIGVIDTKQRGFDDAVFLDSTGYHLVEGSTFNLVFISSQGELVVPNPHSPHDRYLKGITLSSLIETNPGFKWSYQDIEPNQLLNFPHCLALSTTKELLWVNSIEGHKFTQPTKSTLEPFKSHFKSVIQRDSKFHQPRPVISGTDS
jgi:branched-chain amino acid aminotransferase